MQKAHPELVPLCTCRVVYETQNTDSYCSDLKFARKMKDHPVRKLKDAYKGS